MAKEIYLFFGEMGGGKTYHAKKFADENPDLLFIEGDNYVSTEMSARVQNFKLPTKAQIDNLVKVIAWVPVTDLTKNFKGVIICQALYLDEHRTWLIRQWENMGYEVTAVWVKVPFWRNMKQLLTRSRGWRWVTYWLMNKPFFQKPSHDYIHIDEL